MKFKYVSLAVAVSISGCATQNVTNTYTPNENSGKGIAIASVTYNGRYSAYGVRLLSSDGVNKERLEVGQGTILIPYFPKMDFEEDKCKGNVFAIELPTGEYEVTDWYVNSGYAHLNSNSKLGIHFKVVPGKIVYLGNFHFEQTSSAGLTVTGAKVSFKDEVSRDLAVISSKFPNVAKIGASSNVADGKSIESIGGDFSSKVYIPMPIFIKK
jgi:uncharacterized lipoprotein YehR (DUF1307 family)